VSSAGPRQRAVVATRFQCFRQGDDWWWRLLGANNRVLARSARPFASAAAAARDVVAVRELSGTAGPEPEIGLDPASRWRWSLRDGDLLWAVSACGYPRRMECVRAAARFAAEAGSAEPPGDHTFTIPARSSPMAAESRGAVPR
jgi:hypothetical protein